MQEFAHLILTHTERYPALELGDIYRLAHQAAFGAGSPIPNKKTAREWLEHEAKLALAQPTDRTLESVHPGGEIVRVYVGPYLTAGGNLNALLDAYVKSAEAGSGALTAPVPRMAEYWTVLLDLLSPEGALAGKFDRRTALLMEKVRSLENWPAVAHSAAYLHYYQPYYRVFNRKHAEQLLADQDIVFQIE